MVRTAPLAPPCILSSYLVGDYIGRTYIPSIPALQFNSHPKILALSIARVIFVPLFLACNLSTTPGTPYLNSDIMYLIILILFGITNGQVLFIEIEWC